MPAVDEVEYAIREYERPGQRRSARRDLGRRTDLAFEVGRRT